MDRITYRMDKIPLIPKAEELIDIVLSRTQRGTPTVVRKTYHISRIRKFYINKLKKISEEITDRLGAIVDNFPRLEMIHPFYADLINILYDRDHFKLALGHLKGTCVLVKNIQKEYLKLVSYAESLYHAKQLKRAAFGKMATALKKLRESLKYLEDVRKHMRRLPDIDPSSRTIIIAGAPNVGKSSFLSSITRADSEVQGYPFTTKNIYIGSFEYNYIPWQAVDTPGLLDTPLDKKNTAEMQAIIALAHLRGIVLFFLDVSETCGYRVDEQLSVLESTEKVLDKQIVIVANKSDIRKLDELDSDVLARIHAKNREIIEISTLSPSDVEMLKTRACEMYLDAQLILKKDLIEEHKGQLNIFFPPNIKKDAPIVRPKLLPAVQAKKAEIRKAGGLRDGRDLYYIPEDERYDDIPAIYNGKNFADYLDPENLKKLEMLLEEENDYCYYVDAGPSYEELKFIEEFHSHQRAEALEKERKAAVRNDPKIQESIRERLRRDEGYQQMRQKRIEDNKEHEEKIQTELLQKAKKKPDVYTAQFEKKKSKIEHRRHLYTEKVPKHLMVGKMSNGKRSRR